MFQNRACDVAVIGAGPAGLAAAIAAKKAGAERVLIIERDTHPGGILQQCIHPGFGLNYFGKELTGPEYAYLFEKQAEEQGIDIMLDTMVLSLTGQHITATSPHGMVEVEAKAVVLAMGCRERTRGAIRIPRDPSGRNLYRRHGPAPAEHTGRVGRQKDRNPGPPATSA